ncbi:hypothetical protein [Sporosarcina sp. HYO08]|uniref:hypothetical protein n=1 Tax=Sporosarcina sp. HYO08 TaxID=1759557 RepID=UPI00079C7D4F|nr:hypothetical protein [Sporosarcina sp. HYO08]KXH80756.1 hypothetical protein AU377_08420 [Sporosarcina sp. HYO08]
MERVTIDAVEMELRHNMDYIAMLEMIGEGGPIFSEYDEKEELKKNQRTGPKSYDEDELPYDYQ